MQPGKSGSAEWKWLYQGLYVLPGVNFWWTLFCSRWPKPVSPKLGYIRHTPAIHLLLYFCPKGIPLLFSKSSVQSEQKHVTGYNQEIQVSSVFLIQTEARMLLTLDFECIQLLHSTGFETVNVQRCNTHDHFYDTNMVLSEWKVLVWHFDISLQKVWPPSWNSDVFDFIITRLSCHSIMLILFKILNSFCFSSLFKNVVLMFRYISDSKSIP